MVSISNSSGAAAYTRSASSEGQVRQFDPSQGRTQKEGKVERASDTFRNNIEAANTRTDLPDTAKAASNDERRYQDNPKENTAQAVAVRTEAQRGSLLDIAV